MAKQLRPLSDEQKQLIVDTLPRLWYPAVKVHGTMLKSLVFRKLMATKLEEDGVEMYYALTRRGCELRERLV